MNKSQWGRRPPLGVDGGRSEVRDNIGKRMWNAEVVVVVF